MPATETVALLAMVSEPAPALATSRSLDAMLSSDAVPVTVTAPKLPATSPITIADTPESVVAIIVTVPAASMVIWPEPVSPT